VTSSSLVTFFQAWRRKRKRASCGVPSSSWERAHASGSGARARRNSSTSDLSMADSLERASSSGPYAQYAASRPAAASALLREQDSAQDLAGGRLRDVLAELDRAQALVGRDARGDEGEELRGLDRRSPYDEGLRDLAALAVGDADHGRVGERGVRE